MPILMPIYNFTITPNVIKLSFENPYFPSNMFILSMEWLTVNLISIGERYVHLL